MIWNIECNPEILDISYKHAWRTTVIIGGNSYIPRGLLWRSEDEDTLNKSYTTCDLRLNARTVRIALQEFQRPFPDNLCHPHLPLRLSGGPSKSTTRITPADSGMERTPNYRFPLLGKMLVCFYSEVVETATSTSLRHNMYLSHSTMAGNSDILTYTYTNRLVLGPRIVSTLVFPSDRWWRTSAEGHVEGQSPIFNDQFPLADCFKGLWLAWSWSLQKLYIQKRNELNCIKLPTYIKIGTTTACSAFLRWISKCPLPGKYRSEASACGMRLPQNSKLTVLRSQTINQKGTESNPHWRVHCF